MYETKQQHANEFRVDIPLAHLVWIFRKTAEIIEVSSPVWLV